MGVGRRILDEGPLAGMGVGLAMVEDEREEGAGSFMFIEDGWVGGGGADTGM